MTPEPVPGFTFPVPLYAGHFRGVTMNDDDLEDDFPLGDGTAANEALVQCPYCGESVELALDPGSGPSQDYVEDCAVCCRPWRVSVHYGSAGEADVSVMPLSD